jgi:hypothetical protein
MRSAQVAGAEVPGVVFAAGRRLLLLSFKGPRKRDALPPPMCVRGCHVAPVMGAGTYLFRLLASFGVQLGVIDAKKLQCARRILGKVSHESVLDAPASEDRGA